MSRRLLLPLAVGVLVLSLVAAACSGGGQLSHAQYQQQLTQIGKEFDKEQRTALAGIDITNPNDIKKLGDRFRAAADQIDKIADDLDGTNPPDDAAGANAKLVSGFHAIADALRQLASAADQGDIQKLQQLSTEFSNGEAEKELEQAATELEKAGYKAPNPSAT